MPFNYFKEIKIRCDICKTIIISQSETEWSECPCGSTKVLGLKSFIKINGTKYTDLSIYDSSNLPPCQE